MEEPFKIYVLKLAENEFYIMAKFADGREEICDKCYDNYEDCLIAIKEDFVEVKLD